VRGSASTASLTSRTLIGAAVAAASDGGIERGRMGRESSHTGVVVGVWVCRLGLGGSARRPGWGVSI